MEPFQHQTAAIKTLSDWEVQADEFVAGETGPRKTASLGPRASIIIDWRLKPRAGVYPQAEWRPYDICALARIKQVALVFPTSHHMSRCHLRSEALSVKGKAQVKSC